MEITVLLVDSDSSLRGALKNLLAMYRIFRVAAEVETTEEAIDYIQSNPVDVVFVNTLPADARRTSDGNHLSIVLSQSYPHIQTVIYSDSRDKAYYACKSQCAGFLLTPFAPLDFQTLINRLTYIYDLQQAKRESVNRSIMIKTRNGYQMLRLSDVLFVERSGRKNRLVTEDGRETVLLGYTINEIEQMLDGCGFYRCYQSFIVNLSKVAFIRADNGAKNYSIQFKGYDGEILLSRNRYAELVGLLKARYAGVNM